MEEYRGTMEYRGIWRNIGELNEGILGNIEEYRGILGNEGISRNIEEYQGTKEYRGIWRNIGEYEGISTYDITT